MDKKTKHIKAKTRLLVQVLFSAVTNGYILGFIKGKIFTGPSKSFCVPGLNCYSCPGALGACPIGSLQAVLGSRNYRFSFYIIGFLMLMGSLFGRFICGWLCPFGLIQDLLHKIPFPKKRKNLPAHKILVRLKYIILAVFVIILPLAVTDFFGQGKPWFCQFICPSGTLTAGIPLVITNEPLRAAIGFLFSWKVLILVVIVLGSIVIYRPFCKYLCPLGAIYGLFNKISVYRLEIDDAKCIKCKKCQKTCKMDIPVWEKPNSSECIRCRECIHACPTGAIRSTIQGREKKTDKNESIL